MRPTRHCGDDRPEPARTERAFWIALIVTAGLGLSPFYACVTPFAALATLAALKLGRRDAAGVVLLVWLANQAIGYGYLGYPWTWDSAAWGVAIGASACVALLAAGALATARPAPLAVSLPFVGAFTGFEAGLYAAGCVLPGGDGAFSASVVLHVLLVNAVTLCGLMVVYYLAMIPGLLIRHGAGDTRSLGAAS
ncbi:MAG TPA: hypothetical protein VFG12_00260 [Rhodopila sp.]|jgi:hypothetical protein|nr:hypothetical protein [Rhodopila sp.]